MSLCMPLDSFVPHVTYADKIPLSTVEENKCGIYWQFVFEFKRTKTQFERAELSVEICYPVSEILVGGALFLG